MSHLAKLVRQFDYFIGLEMSEQPFGFRWAVGLWFWGLGLLVVSEFSATSNCCLVLCRVEVPIGAVLLGCRLRSWEHVYTHTQY